MNTKFLWKKIGPLYKQWKKIVQCVQCANTPKMFPVFLLWTCTAESDRKNGFNPSQQYRFLKCNKTPMTTVHSFWNVTGKPMVIDEKSNFSKIRKKPKLYNSGLLLIIIFSKPTGFYSIMLTKKSNSSELRKIRIFWFKKSFFRRAKKPKYQKIVSF